MTGFGALLPAAGCPLSAIGGTKRGNRAPSAQAQEAGIAVLAIEPRFQGSAHSRHGAGSVARWVGSGEG